MTNDQEKILIRYGKAYRAANGTNPPPILHCGNGIFKIAHHQKAHKISAFGEWAERLETRVVGETDDGFDQSRNR